MTERVLVVAAHPDDETLGCGATLAKHVNAGDAVMAIFLADGAASRMPLPGTDIERRRQCVAALDELGITQNAFGTFPDNQFDSVPLLSIIRDIEEAISVFRPTTVYTHWKGDLNVDHRITHEAVKVACRPQPDSMIAKLLYFEVPCSTTWGATFAPDYFIEVSDTWARKLTAWDCYRSERRDAPHARSVEAITALAHHRGYAIGVPVAEAFMVGRIVA